MRPASRVFFSIVLVLALTGTALPWGDAPTHFSIGYDAAQADRVDNEDIFIRANACPDIANTQLFKSLGLGYVHSLEFAKCVYEVANAPRYSFWHPDWLATAYAWGAHIAADSVIHYFLTEEEPCHQLIEISIDTVIYYDPLTPEMLKVLNVSPDCCDPWLIYLASRCYRNKYPGVPLAYPWWVQMALGSLRTTIQVEYCYIEAKGGSDLSEAFLYKMVDKGYLEGNWEDHYSYSITEVLEWIADPLSYSLPYPPP